MKNISNIYEPLFTHYKDPKLLYSSLRSSFTILPAYEKLSFANSISCFIPFTEVKIDSQEDYISLWLEISEYLRDTDFFGIAQHLAYSIPFSQEFKGIEQILDQILAHLNMLKTSIYFSKSFPLAFIKIATNWFLKSPIDTKVSKMIIKILKFFTYHNLLNLADIQKLLIPEIIDLLSNSNEQLAEISQKNEIKEFPIQERKNLSFQIPAENKEKSPILSQSVIFEPKEENKKNQEKINIPENSIKKNAIDLYHITSQYGRIFKEIHQFMNISKELLTKSATEKKFPEYTMHSFLPVKCMLNECTLIIEVPPENNVYNLLRLIQNSLSEIPRFLNRPYEKELRVTAYEDPADLRERNWIPYVNFHSYNKRDPEDTITIKIYANNLSLYYTGLLMTKYFEFDSRAETVCIFIGSWAMRRGIINPENGFLSLNALYLMIIFFLQILSEPVLDSIQQYAEMTINPPVYKGIPSIETIKSRPTKEHYKVYNKETLRLTDFVSNFTQVDVNKMREDLKYPKNNNTTTELITKFFYYFGFEQPDQLSNTNMRKMSIRYKKYLEAENTKINALSAFLVEDPIFQEINAAGSVIIGSPEHKKIIEEFKKGYKTMLEYSVPDDGF